MRSVRTLLYRGVSVQGGLCLGVSVQEGLCPGGGLSAQEGSLSKGGALSKGGLPDRQTDTCENITFAVTSHLK